MSESGKPRYIGYVRGLHSTEQRARLTAEAQRRGWELVDVIQGDFALHQAITRVQRDGLAGVMVTDLTRIARTIGAANDLYSAATDNGWTVAVVGLGR